MTTSANTGPMTAPTDPLAARLTGHKSTLKSAVKPEAKPDVKLDVKPDLAPLCAMIFAAGRGERMRPLTDHTPKPLLPVGGKPLIVWQIERLAQAGFTRIVINHAWLGDLIEKTLGDGSSWGVHLSYSAEGSALETAGAIAQARPLLEYDGRPRVFVAVSGDVFSDFDYRTLRQRVERAQALQAEEAPRLHLVMVPNPVYHAQGDFALNGAQLSLEGTPRYTFASFGIYDTRMFNDLRAGEKKALLPYYQAAIAGGHASGELYCGRWENIGTVEQLQALDQALRCTVN
jgi:N-acetyl-alpha-D-muramate 1-phosphate uridylyltransferase